MNNKFTLTTVYGIVLSNKLEIKSIETFESISRDGAPMNVNVTAIIER